MVDPVNTQKIDIPKDGLFLFLDGHNRGPLTQDEILEMFQLNKVQRTTPMWFAGLPNWISVGDIAELDRRKYATPPAEVPLKDRPDAIIVQIKDQFIPLRPGSIKALVQWEDLRRTNLAHDDSSMSWVRADQHPIIKNYFFLPATPQEPAPVANVVAFPNQASASAQASGQATAQASNSASQSKVAPVTQVKKVVADSPTPTSAEKSSKWPLIFVGSLGGLGAICLAAFVYFSYLQPETEGFTNLTSTETQPPPRQIAKRKPKTVEFKTIESKWDVVPSSEHSNINYLPILKIEVTNISNQDVKEITVEGIFKSADREFGPGRAILQEPLKPNESRFLEIYPSQGLTQKSAVVPEIKVSLQINGRPSGEVSFQKAETQTLPRTW